MILRHHAHGPDGTRRRGVILIVVLALLTLFAIMGLTFVLYSDSEATSSRIFKEAGPQVRERDQLKAAVDSVWKLFLGQLIYDVSDTDNSATGGPPIGVHSAIRGHSLARSLYGWSPGQLNDKPYSGTGRLHE